jgi:hypothetical protein
MKMKNLLLIGYTSAMMLCSGVMNGQQGVLLPQNEETLPVMPRRISRPNHRDIIGSTLNVDGTFGAGESSAVGQQTKVVWPAPSGTSLPSVLVGSGYSKNAVIGIYDGNGLATGELRDVRLYKDGVGSDNNTIQPNRADWYADSQTQLKATRLYYRADKDLGSYAAIATTANRYDTGKANTVDSGLGSIFWPYRTDNGYIVIAYNHITGWQAAADTLKFTFFEDTADTLYTSTQNLIGQKDDGQSLLYIHDGKYSADGDLTKYATVLSTAQYVRPTTVLLSKTNILDEIAVGDVEWYAAYMYGKVVNTDSIDPFWLFSGSGCGHYSGWVSYIRDDVEFDTIQAAAGQGHNEGIYPSGRYVDAAVRLLDGAEVNVRGDVSDETEISRRLTVEPNDNLYGITDALLVLPGANSSQGRSNFLLKIAGNADMIHMQDSGAYDPTALNADPLTDGYLYSDTLSGQGPGAPYPVTKVSLNLPIYLSGAGNTYSTYNEVGGLIQYDHPREAGTLTIPNVRPYTSTTASVYGVKGEYNGLAEIHTRTVDGYDTTAIIETGSGTNNQDKFHIYSIGMLKNFRSIHYSVGQDSVVIGDAGNKAPNFHLSNDSALYIINDGKGDGSYIYEAGIRFNSAGVDSLNSAIANAGAGGDLHIQANSFVRFYDGNLDFDVQSNKDNEIKILSDGNGIYVEKDLNFKADTAHLTVWAKGAADANRGITHLYDPANVTGSVKLDKDVNVKYTGSEGSGLLLIRSENDDVLVTGSFDFANSVGTAESGELMVQGGQDVRVNGNVTLTWDGQRSMLFEAKKTAYFGGDFSVSNTITGAKNGDLIIKAGYPDFLPTADVNALTNWTPPGICFPDGYANREANQPANTGGDIWFGGNVDIRVNHPLSDSIDTYIRAYNSIHMDRDFTHTLTSHYTSGGDYVDTTLLFAEAGNIEAMNSGAVQFNVSANDSTYLLLQSGNMPGDPCGITSSCFANNNWDGNILFGKDKTLTINHKGVGPTLISSSRDIENQIGAAFTFTYQNTGLSKNDSLLITAGRHIETHASYLFDYSVAGANITNSVTMRAGHQTADCNWYLPKTVETASTPGYSGSGKENGFAADGAGQGSILLFDSVTFDYDGKGQILLTALNGNIESDPYLHKGALTGYPNGSPIIFNYGGAGVTRMEAIDIKLHDRLEYNGQGASSWNGEFYIAAFDSILTRSISYNNTTAQGNIYITTDKLKRNGSGTPLGSDYDTSTGGPGIHQGHIVLGYGADATGDNVNDSIVFNFRGNPNTAGANVYIRAGYDGFAYNPVTGKVNSADLFKNRPSDAGKGYGGNITFDYVKADMAKGNHTSGGYMEISTPNGNIWGKDSLSFNAWNGDLLVDAGLGSVEDTLRATRWSTFSTSRNGNGHEDLLNTCVALSCDDNGSEWRTGNIMMKGGVLAFNDGTGNATFRTREGFIDTYDAFTVSNMKGHLLKYAGLDDAVKARRNNWGDVSERDFRYVRTANGGSVFFGADDNIMLNYGNSNFMYNNYGNGGMGYPGGYDVTGVNRFEGSNPFYHSSFEGYIDGLRAATYNVNKDGYLFYKNYTPHRKLHRLYRGCIGSDCSGSAGVCNTTSNGARDLTFDYRGITSGGVAAVASNYIDLFTRFDYYGGAGTGLHAVPGMNTLHGEAVAGYGLYIKSQFNGEGSNYPERRRAVCENCGVSLSWPIGDAETAAVPEMTYVGFHDDARIHTQNQKSLIEAPVIEFFGHAELDSETDSGSKTKLTLKGDSLIFHDSVIFDGRNVELLPFTTDAIQRSNDMRYGVINDRGTSENYSDYGPAIEMVDRRLPVLELGYQRCTEPGVTFNSAPNKRSQSGLERTPRTGGDVIVTFKHGFSLPIYNTVVANNARISFISDSLDGVMGGEYLDAFIRTDLLRIRNSVEFYTDPLQPKNRTGKFVLATPSQMDDQMIDPGMYTRHLHMEPGSELSIPGEDSLIVIPTTVVGGYGNIHENVFVKSGGVLAPGYASLMESDCQTPEGQGSLTVHNLQMEQGAEMRISVSNRVRTITKGATTFTTNTDVITIDDTLFTYGKIPVVVLPEEGTLAPGNYTFLTFGDSSGLSREYAKNFVLVTQRYEECYFALDFTKDGVVSLNVTDIPDPDIQRYVDLPAVEGVTTVPEARRHYVSSHRNFTFRATYTGAPLRVTATGFYSGRTVDLDETAKALENSEYEYAIYQITEPWTVYIGPEISTVFSVSNSVLESRRVWAYRNTLYINAEKEDVASIYNMTGVLYKRIEIPEGLNRFTLERGIYVVTMKDGSVYRIIIR